MRTPSAGAVRVWIGGVADRRGRFVDFGGVASQRKIEGWVEEAVRKEGGVCR